MIIWKDVPEFEGYYEASSDGQIKSLEKKLTWGHSFRIKSENIAKPYKNNKGYLCIDLYRNKQVFKLKLHRIIAITFILNPENKAEVNHKDLNKANNTVENLEWVSKKENTNHAKLHNRYKGNPKLTNNQVIEIRNLKGKYKQVELSKMFNISTMSISRILRNISHSRI